MCRVLLCAINRNIALYVVLMAQWVLIMELDNAGQ